MEIFYSEEDDIRFPSLTIRQILLFILLDKELPLSNDLITVLGRVVRISHVFSSHVGKDFIRGTGDGDRKRVLSSRHPLPQQILPPGTTPLEPLIPAPQ